jgi:hypothetical protein
MTNDCDAENWLGNPTREEMLELHAKLVEAECNCMRSEVDRYRKNQATLVDMLTTTISNQATGGFARTDRFG